MEFETAGSIFALFGVIIVGTIFLALVAKWMIVKYRKKDKRKANEILGGLLSNVLAGVIGALLVSCKDSLNLDKNSPTIIGDNLVVCLITFGFVAICLAMFLVVLWKFFPSTSTKRRDRN